MPRTSPRLRSESPIASARIEAGLTQAQLAALVGCTQKDISRWETGAHRPNVVALMAISDALKVPMEQLIAPQK